MNKNLLLFILQVFQFCMKESKEKAMALIEKLQIKLTPEEKDLEQKQLLKTVMRKWLPAGEALLQVGIIIKHLLNLSWKFGSLLQV